ncbi:MAG: cation transporter [Helicobacter sp.]|nr:cation transporter [Helicobacter sp.]
MKIQCINIKCEGCVTKIKESFGEKYPNINVDVSTQTLEVDAKEEDLPEIQKQLQELGFFKSEGIAGKIKNFFTR